MALLSMAKNLRNREPRILSILTRDFHDEVIKKYKKEMKRKVEELMLEIFLSLNTSKVFFNNYDFRPFLIQLFFIK